jgi:cytochrome c oxidase subunit 3
MSVQTLDKNNINEPEYLVNPKKVVLWLLIVASVMLFAGFTSAYIVRRGEGNWELFKLPSSFFISTIIILASSVSMQFSLISLKKGSVSTSKSLLFTTFVLGIAFCITQYYGWQQLIADNVYFAFSNPSNSFVYVITGVHVFHVTCGLVFVLSMIIQSLRNKLSSTNSLFLSMCNTYWHFIGILWIYLYVFLTLYR